MRILKWMGLFLFFLSLENRVAAQTNSITLAPEFGINIPTGVLSDVSGLGLGFGLQAQFPIQRTGFSFLARTGLDVFFGKTFYDGNQYVTTSTSVALPLLIGGRYYLVDKLHADAEVGALIGLDRYSTAAFDFAPSLGYSLRLGKGYFDPFFRVNTSFEAGGTFVTFGARYQIPVH